MENENEEEFADETGKPSIFLKIGVILVLVVFPVAALMEIAFFSGACYAIKHYGTERVFDKWRNCREVRKRIRISNVRCKRRKFGVRRHFLWKYHISRCREKDG